MNKKPMETRKLTGIEFLCSGSVRIVLSQAEARISAQINVREDGAVTIPPAAADALIRTEGGTR